ncbi:hypothetical protein NQZ68_026159 [Dissostichus eleginoides]|nr:hypothetical protein NQZ68_026159 [Dissostichus eleginoides]
MWPTVHFVSVTKPTLIELNKVISASSARCAVITSIPAGGAGAFHCKGMNGRFVNIVIPEEFLSLCEVEVYGSRLD